MANSSQHPLTLFTEQIFAVANLLDASLTSIGAATAHLEHLS